MLPPRPQSPRLHAAILVAVSLADGGMGLGTMWGEQTARRMLSEAGFTSVEARRLDGDIVKAYLIATKD